MSAIPYTGDPTNWPEILKLPYDCAPDFWTRAMQCYRDIADRNAYLQRISPVITNAFLAAPYENSSETVWSEIMHVDLVAEPAHYLVSFQMYRDQSSAPNLGGDGVIRFRSANAYGDTGMLHPEADFVAMGQIPDHRYARSFVLHTVGGTKLYWEGHKKFVSNSGNLKIASAPNPFGDTYINMITVKQ